MNRGTDRPPPCNGSQPIVRSDQTQGAPQVGRSPARTSLGLSAVKAAFDGVEALEDLFENGGGCVGRRSALLCVGEP